MFRSILARDTNSADAEAPPDMSPDNLMLHVNTDSPVPFIVNNVSNCPVPVQAGDALVGTDKGNVAPYGGFRSSDAAFLVSPRTDSGSEYTESDEDAHELERETSEQRPGNIIPMDMNKRFEALMLMNETLHLRVTQLEAAAQRERTACSGCSELQAELLQCRSAMEITADASAQLSQQLTDLRVHLITLCKVPQERLQEQSDATVTDKTHLSSHHNHTKAAHEEDGAEPFSPLLFSDSFAARRSTRQRRSSLPTLVRPSDQEHPSPTATRDKQEQQQYTRQRHELQQEYRQRQTSPPPLIAPVAHTAAGTGFCLPEPATQPARPPRVRRRRSLAWTIDQALLNSQDPAFKPHAHAHAEWISDPHAHAHAHASHHS